MPDGISIIIPTYNGGIIFLKCLDAIKKQKYTGRVQIIVIDSGSSDGTPEAAEAVGAIVKRIEQKDFHHSRTRNEAVTLASFSKVVFLVQDAIPLSENWLEDFADTLDHEDIAAAYGRQIPHIDADIYARFEVEYHNTYLGDEPIIQSIDSLDSFTKSQYDEALRRVRFDNVCSIYNKDLLLKHPFPDVTFAEDMAWAHHIMLLGYNILYQPKVKVSHSHNRSPEYRFRRAIVNSLACAKILGCVKEDLSFLTTLDLFQISKKIEINIDKMKNMVWGEYNNFNKNEELLGMIRKGIVKNTPLFKRIFFHIISKFPQSSRRKAWIYAYECAIEQHIQFVLSMIMERSPHATIEELYVCIDQIAASTTGGLFGEVYASCKLSGKVSPSPEMEAIISPYLKGV